LPLPGSEDDPDPLPAITQCQRATTKETQHKPSSYLEGLKSDGGTLAVTSVVEEDLEPIKLEQRQGRIVDGLQVRHLLLLVFFTCVDAKRMPCVNGLCERVCVRRARYR
jgi:hypothetical protein